MVALEQQRHHRPRHCHFCRHQLDSFSVQLPSAQSCHRSRRSKLKFWSETCQRHSHRLLMPLPFPFRWPPRAVLAALTASAQATLPAPPVSADGARLLRWAFGGSESGMRGRNTVNAARRSFGSIRSDRNATRSTALGAIRAIRAHVSCRSSMCPPAQGRFISGTGSRHINRASCSARWTASDPKPLPVRLQCELASARTIMEW